jgi:phosphoribosylformylglycinamidine synthase
MAAEVEKPKRRASVVDDASPGTLELALERGLSEAEWQWIGERLGRTPTVAETGVFTAMFSEHCSYKSSRPFLRRLPTTGKRVLQGPGENAGVVSVGRGYAVVFKMESHNHPSFIEPYQGAATGVGGILRDIFTMGARPIGSMNALCFGGPKGPRRDEIVRGVVRGIGDYGNCVGVPTVAGQTFFHSCYDFNPLVNAFTLGLVEKDRIFKGEAKGEGNLIVYVGAKTGRDGVHGATMSSKQFSSDVELERPTVQVGDPFTEKLLLEATLEAMRAGLVVGIQDMGAAGLTSASFEMAHRAGMALAIDLDRVPTREEGMSAYEILLSESQERMLLVAKPEHWDELSAIFDKWDLHAEVLGSVLKGDTVRMTYKGRVVVDLPVASVVDGPLPERPLAAPSDLEARWVLDRSVTAGDLPSAIRRAFEDPNFASAAPIVEQYDSMVGNRTEGGTYDDAAVLHLRDVAGPPLRLALSTDCNPRVCWLDPREGGRRAVAEAALNCAVRGAEPIGLTDCLNFGSPENPEVMWQFAESIEGIREACLALQVPVVSGNVSFYNDTDGTPIYPTPMIGMVGLIDQDERSLPPSTWTGAGQSLALLGPIEGGLGGSSFAAHVSGRDSGRPEATDLNLVVKMVALCPQIVRALPTVALHDVSDGGLVLALAEMAFRAGDEIGVRFDVPKDSDPWRTLFGETVPRVLAVVEPADRQAFEQLCSQAGVQCTWIGATDASGRFLVRVGGQLAFDESVSVLRDCWDRRWRTLWEDH